MYTRKKIVNIEKKDNSCYNQQEKKKNLPPSSKNLNYRPEKLFINLFSLT